MHHKLTEYSTTKGVPIILHENKFFRMMFNGFYHYLEGVRYGEGVGTVPMFKNGDFLLVRLQRAPAIGMSIEFPRGGVDRQEQPKDGAIRELKEETGCSARVETISFLGNVGADTATLNGTMGIWLVPIDEEKNIDLFDEGKISEVIRVSRKEFTDMISSGKIIDGITLASFALLMAFESHHPC